MAIETCSVQDARIRLTRGDCSLLDVREYPEYVEAHVAGGKLLPLGELRERPEQAGHGEVLVLCRSGRRAREAAELLVRRGDVRPVVIEGGIDAWKQAGYPVSQAKGPISLERQVRIAAGTLVLAGLLIPGAVPLSYFVGAGLIFAGITNTCAMGLLLARLPWNRPRGPVGTGEGGALVCPSK